MMLWRKKVTSSTGRVCEFECEGVSRGEKAWQSLLKSMRVRELYFRNTYCGCEAGNIPGGVIH